MKKYLREIEMAGVILASTGIVNSLIWGSIPVIISNISGLSY